MSLLVIYNPVCGDRTAEQLFRSEVIPRLEAHSKVPDSVIATTHPNHAGEIVLDLLKTKDSSETITIILGSGDGTLHEIVTALHHSLAEEAHATLQFVLVPSGTANALYSSLFPLGSSEPSTEYRFGSLDLYLSSSSKTIPLATAVTTIDSSHPDKAPVSSVAVVVASTSLHAAILHDSEALRSTHPGIERFKIAAQENITRWYRANVRLLPLTSDPSSVEIYDVSSRQFRPIGKGDVSNYAAGAIELDGPFAYFLSTINVDRLEPAFRITPLQTTLPPTKPTLDVVVVRPLRDPSMNGSELETERTRFAEKSGVILGGAYRNGAHVHMIYGDDGSIKEGQGEEALSSVVEYYRCGGWEWAPVSCLNTVECHEAYY